MIDLVIGIAQNLSNAYWMRYQNLRRPPPQPLSRACSLSSEIFFPFILGAKFLNNNF